MAVEFSGTSQYYIAATTPITAVPITIAVWGNGDTASNLHMVSVADADNTDNYFSLLMNGSTSVVYREVVSGPTTGQAQTSAGLANNTWGHMVGTGQTSTARTAYLNGGSTGTNAQNVIPLTVDQLGVGCKASSDAATNEFNGELFWPAIWNVILTSAEIGHLSNGASPLTIRRPNLVFFARFANTSAVYDIVAGLVLVASASSPTDSVSDPDGLKRITGRGRGRHRMRI